MHPSSPFQCCPPIPRRIPTQLHGSFDDPGFTGRGRYSEKMAPEINITEWRKGSQWFEVNRKLALDIVGDSIFHSKFEQFCTGECYPDEHYFPTMLSIQSPLLLANRSLTWVDWSRGGAHPATFGKDDIKMELFKRMFRGETCFHNGKPTKLCYLFARKFSPDALEQLLEYATRIFYY
ncbi:unnamed protein product [Thlaspi arvense]|uniref:Uncharacterized protein n=1 Tax=Thlaspi arvense TaxID=13288 RepID=A0AAU9SYQ5_THLAR|nr:unnamed protein product [Thlaspi arvense]